MVTEACIRFSKWVLFALWLAFWGYSATQMLAFSTRTYRDITIPASLLWLVLWSFAFALGAKGMPFPAKLTTGKNDHQKFMSLRGFTWYIPMVFAGFISIIYVITQMVFKPYKPSWPSPAIPAVIMFSPMVFIFAVSFMKANQATDVAGNGPRSH